MMLVTDVEEKAWKIDGFRNFYHTCSAWAREIQEKYHGNYFLNFWIANERFPVARLFFEKALVVELWHHPQFQTAACLSGKAKHVTTEKISRSKNIFLPYLPTEYLVPRTPIINTP